MPVEPVVRGGRIVYETAPDRLQEVGADYPAPAVKAAAAAALRAALADLHLPASTAIVWCLDESSTSRKLRERYGATPWRTATVPVKARGLVEPAATDVLWVHADQTPEAAAETVRHEGRHAWQLEAAAGRWMLPGLTTMAEREADAVAYAASPPTLARRSSTPSRSSAATRTRHSPTMAEQALAARRASFFQHKGRLSSRCEHCAEIVPLNTTHRCREASLRRPW